MGCQVVINVIAQKTFYLKLSQAMTCQKLLGDPDSRAMSQHGYLKNLTIFLRENIENFNSLTWSLVRILCGSYKNDPLSHHLMQTAPETSYF